MTISNRRCLMNGNQRFNTSVESQSLRAPGEPYHEKFFELTANNVYGRRRFTLFNLYAFPDYQSSYKSPPSLTITNCDFEYFLGGYESLITIENNNLQRVERTFTW